jgi:hypothetical protein
MLPGMDHRYVGGGIVIRETIVVAEEVVFQVVGGVVLVTADCKATV